MGITTNLPAKPTPKNLLLDLWPHPLTTEGRHTVPVKALVGSTVTDALFTISQMDYAGRKMPMNKNHVMVILDGVLIDRLLWNETFVKPGQTMQVRTIVHGGDGSNPLAVILTIALIVAAPYAAGFLSGGAVAGSVAYGVAYAGFIVAGQLIIAAVAPPRLPDQPETPGRAATTFSITNGSNAARLYQPVMLVLGNHRVFPDLAAREFTELAGADVVLSQIFDFGLGAIQISEIQIGDTPIESYNEVTQELSSADNDYAAQSLVAGNVDAVAGGALDSPAETIIRNSPAETNRIVLDFTGRQGSFHRKKGYPQTRTAAIAITWFRTGHARDTGGVTAIGFSGDPTKPVRLSRTLDLPVSARWTVEVRRTTAKNIGTRDVDEITFTQMRCYQADAGNYYGRTRLAMRIRASGQLQGRIDRLSAMVQQTCPVFINDAWSDVESASTNPAAILRWFALGKFHNGAKLFGIGLPAARVDDVVLGEWYERCATLGLECNAVITTPTTHADLINLICQAGDAAMTWATGKLGVVWQDQADQPSALFTPGNTLAGSVRVSYTGATAPSEIVVQYLDPQNDWQFSTVRRPVIGGGASNGPASTITLRGITNRAQATREANLIAARQHYHRRTITFSAAMETLAVTRGDVIYMSSDLITGGDSGRLKAGSESSRLNFSRAIAFTNGVDDYLVIRLPDGTLHASEIQASADADFDGDIIAGEIPQQHLPHLSAHPEDFLFKFYRAGEAPLKLRVLGIEPQANNQARITCIDEVAEFYNAVAGAEADDPRRRAIAPVISDIQIAESLTLTDNVYAVRFYATLTFAGDYRGAVIRVADGDSQAEFVATADASGQASWLGAASGVLEITATPGSEVYASGASYSVTHIIQGKLWPPADVVNFSVVVQGDGTREFAWSPNEDVDLAGYQIRYSATSPDAAAWEDMTPLHEGLITQAIFEVNSPPAGSWTFAIKAVDTGARESSGATFIIEELGDNRLGPTIYYSCENAAGWPGQIYRALLDDDGSNTLRQAGTREWDDLIHWGDLVAWTPPSAERVIGGDNIRLNYVTLPIDLGADISFSINYESLHTGAVSAVVYASSVSAAAAVAAATAAAITADTIPPAPLHVIGDVNKGRWVVILFNYANAMDMDEPPIITINRLCISIYSDSADSERIHDADTAGWARGANGGRVIPTALTSISDVNITIQSVGAGWSSSLLSKAPPEIALYNAAAVIDDAVVDVQLFGVSI